MQQVCTRRNALWDEEGENVAETAVCARPWEAARCVLPAGILPQACSGCTPQVVPCRWGAAQATPRAWRPTAPAWQGPRAPWYAFAGRARRAAAGPHDGRRAAGRGGGKPLASTHTPCTRGNGRTMHGTRFAQFSTEVLRRGATAVLPQHLPDRWLDALLEEADLLAPVAGDPQEDDRVHESCAGLLGAVLVVLMEQRGHPDQLEVAVSTLMSHLHCYRFCRKVRFLGQNPKIGYQKFNDLQTAKISKKQLCDRTLSIAEFSL